MKRINWGAIVIMLGVFSVFAEVPEGFAIYSKGDDYSRTLHMVKLSPGMTEAQIAATETKICNKGSDGGDIEGQISFDGKWLAFARSAGATSEGEEGGYGGNDYHQHDKWDLYIVRIDGALPATPKKVEHGFWPSWGNDSYNATKTLYYSTSGAPHGSTIRAVTVGSNGELSNDRQVATVPAQVLGRNFGGHTMCSPDGNFMVAYNSPFVGIYHFNGPLKGQEFKSDIFGCMPSICADSKWIIHANHKRIRFDGTGKGDISGNGGGDYHYGTSQDMKWFVSRTSGDWKVQNDGRNVHLFKMTTSDWDLSTSRQVLLTTSGSWPDVHVGTVAPPEPALKLAPATLNFSAMVGQNNPIPQIVTVTAEGGLSLSDLAFTKNPAAAWLVITSSGTGATRTLTNTVELKGLQPSTYGTKVTVTAGGKSQQYDVALELKNKPAFASAESLSAKVGEPIGYKVKYTNPLDEGAQLTYAKKPIWMNTMGDSVFGTPLAVGVDSLVAVLKVAGVAYDTLVLRIHIDSPNRLLEYFNQHGDEVLQVQTMLRGRNVVFQVRTQDEGTYFLHIHDVVGRQLWEHAWISREAHTHWCVWKGAFDLARPVGIYFLSISNHTTTAVARLVINSK